MMFGSKRPAALLLTPVLPQPSHSGRATRAWGWLTELAREHDVHVLVTDPLPSGFELPQGHPATSIRSLAPVVHVPGRLERLAGIVLPPLVLVSRRFIADWRSPNDDLLDDIAAPDKIQKIIVFRVYLHDIASQLFARHPGAERILDMDDLESQTRASIALALLQAGRPSVALRLFASSLQYRLVEARLCRAYSMTLLASPEDAVRLGKRAQRATAFRPNRVPDPGVRKARAIGNRLSLLFVGSLDYFPNEVAARFIAQRLVPKLREQLSLPFQVTIAGRRASPELLDILARCPEIRCYSDADNLDPLYDKADIVLAPLRSGGGTKIKVIEAFAHTRTVIATSEGVRGLSVQRFKHYLAATSAEEFVSVIQQLVGGNIDGAAVAEAGRRFCEALCQWHRD